MTNKFSKNKKTKIKLFFSKSYQNLNGGSLKHPNSYSVRIFKKCLELFVLKIPEKFFFSVFGI